MKRGIVRIICMLLCCVLFTVGVIPADAASSVSEIENRLEKMSNMSKYRDASYTAFDGKGWGKGCYAFVNALSRELFGTGIPPQKANSAGKYTRLNVEYNKNWTEIGVASSNDEVKSLLQSAQAGDIIQYSSQSTKRHIAMIFSVSDESICRWSASSKAGAHFNTHTWNKLAGYNIGLGDFTADGYGLSLYRCTKNVKAEGETSITFSNYQVRKLTETSAEPYATATASSGKVARVGMFIGGSKDSMVELGTDNGTPKPMKNMWYNTTKYGYPLEPGTTYYYQPYAEVNGKRYDGEIQSFTTPGEKYVPEPPTETVVPNPPTEPTYTALVTCNADNLNVRKGPGTNHDKVGSLKRGSKCTVYPNRASGEWTWVMAGDVSGYVSADRLTKFTGNTRTGVVICKADLLNVRKGPGTGYEKVGQIPRGASCTVYLDVKADWYFVTYGDIAGYASKNMIKI